MEEMDYGALENIQNFKDFDVGNSLIKPVMVGSQ